jgi:hypothetical protein
LQLAGCIACIGALLEHRHHNNLYWNLAWFRSGGLGNGHQEEEGSKNSRKGHH